MKYNFDYLNIKYALMTSFMHNANRDLLDVSYRTEGKKITIQVVLLQGKVLSDKMRDRVTDNLPGFEIIINELHLTKEQFNDNKGEWSPKYYNWLENVLFCKAEVL